MDEKSDQIIGHIEAQRDKLGQNLDEFEDKIRRTADWRTHFDKNPMLVLGAALGGGLLLGATVGGRRKSSSASSAKSRKFSNDFSSADSTPNTYYASQTGADSSSSLLSSAMSSPHMQQVTEAFDSVKGALVAFGISKMKEFLSTAVPGLDRHLGGSATTEGHPDSDDFYSSDTASGAARDYRAGDMGPASAGSKPFSSQAT
ncbi:MAG: hypothetical protein H7Y20_19525 [Bryobacteraceae bacterium]|nr:hypothetical protein [Bryobacteraceae bacterium]